MASNSLNLKLSHKIGSISAIAVLGIAAIAGIYVFGVSVQEAYQRKADAANAIFGLASELQVRLLESRRAEKDFLLRNDLKYADNHTALQNTITNSIDKLQQQAQASGFDEIAQKADVVSDGFKRYAVQFNGLVASKKRQGLSETTGLEGSLRDSVHAIETTLNELKDPKFLVTMLMMRRHEKDFMLRHDAKYGGEMKKRATEMLAALDQSDLAPASKDKIRQGLTAYQRDFFSWMEISLTVIDEQKTMSDGYAAIAPVVDAIGNTAKDLRATSVDENLRLSADIKLKMFIAMFLIAIAVSALSYWIARSISRPLRALTGGMRELAGGNFDVVLPGLGRKDEIGDIAGAIDVFKVKAAEKAQREADERVALDKKAAAEREAAMQKMADDFEAAVGSIVKAAIAGDFAQRVDLRDKTGLVLNVGTAINSLCENTAKALDDLIKMLNALAAGNLTQRITAEYQGNFAQLKDNANTTAERIGAIVSDIKASAREVTNASAEISTSTTDLSQRTEEQAASLEETSASMEEISATVKKNAEHAQAANQSAMGTREVATKGGAVVAEAVIAMAKIEESSRKIADIIGVIDEIARQTNLLALNAAVEAARAGDAGRGFAVVASEVRSLAQRSSQAAKDIKDLITNSGAQVKEGVDLVNRTGGSLKEIVGSISKMAEIVSDIANASIEQAAGIEQVNKALTQMDEVTQQNSALVEENAATAKTLEHQAKAMDERVAFFQVDESAATGGAIRTVATAAPATSRPTTKATAPRQAPTSVRQGNGVTKRGPVGHMQAALATKIKEDPDWKEF